jgi:hypothetical protein
MQFLRCLVIASVVAGMGLSLGCGDSDPTIMKGMQRGTGEPRESHIPLKGGKKKPEPDMSPAPRRVPGA